MKHRAIVILLVIIVGGLLVLTICYFTNKSSSDFGEYVNDSSVYDRNNIFEKISELDNANITPIITDDIDTKYDYYVCLYIRSALIDYIRDNSIDYNTITFACSEEGLFTLEDMDHVAINMVSSDGVCIYIKMDRTKDTWEYEVR